MWTGWEREGFVWLLVFGSKSLSKGVGWEGRERSATPQRETETEEGRRGGKGDERRSEDTRRVERHEAARRTRQMMRCSPFQEQLAKIEGEEEEENRSSATVSHKLPLFPPLLLYITSREIGADFIKTCICHLATFSTCVQT
jgi:hypothetical protein